MGRATDKIDSGGIFLRHMSEEVLAYLLRQVSANDIVEMALAAFTLPLTGVTPGTYTYASVTIDAQGRVTVAANGTTPLTGSGGSGQFAYYTGMSTLGALPLYYVSGDGFRVGSFGAVAALWDIPTTGATPALHASVANLLSSANTVNFSGNQEGAGIEVTQTGISLVYSHGVSILKSGQGSGVKVLHSGTAGQGVGSEISNSANASNALYGSTVGAGRAAHLVSTGPGQTLYVLQGRNATDGGGALVVEITGVLNASNVSTFATLGSGNAVQAYASGGNAFDGAVSAGTGIVANLQASGLAGCRALVAEITNGSNGATAAYIRTQGSGIGLRTEAATGYALLAYGNVLGNSGAIARVHQDHGSADAVALQIVQDGPKQAVDISRNNATGAVAVAKINNASSSSVAPTLQIDHANAAAIALKVIGRTETSHLHLTVGSEVGKYVRCIDADTGELEYDDVEIEDLVVPPGFNSHLVKVDKTTDSLRFMPGSGILTVRAVATSNISSFFGALTIDGALINSQDLFLAAGQSTASENGVYRWVEDSGTVRISDDPLDFNHIWVAEGTTYQRTRWNLVTTGAITLGTTSLAYELQEQRLSRVTASGLAYTATGNERYIGITAIGGTGIAITLKTLSTLDAGAEIFIKDENGLCNAGKTITLTTAGPTIDGAASVTYNVAYTGVTLRWNGSKYQIQSLYP